MLTAWRRFTPLGGLEMKLLRRPPFVLLSSPERSRGAAWTPGSIDPPRRRAREVPGNLAREIREFLRLTDAQYESIVRNSSRNRSAQAGILLRVNPLNREIETETRREPPDTGALGASYQEIESQCRR